MNGEYPEVPVVGCVAGSNVRSYTQLSLLPLSGLSLEHLQVGRGGGNFRHLCTNTACRPCPPGPTKSGLYFSHREYFRVSTTCSAEISLTVRSGVSCISHIFSARTVSGFSRGEAVWAVPGRRGIQAFI